jgi:hypothetical protein
MEGPQVLENEEFSKEGGLLKEWKQIKDPTPRPPITRSISNNKKGRIPKRMLSLEKPSPIITTCLEIKATCAHYNATNILCL